MPNYAKIAIFERAGVLMLALWIYDAHGTNK